MPKKDYLTGKELLDELDIRDFEIFEWLEKGLQPLSIAGVPIINIAGQWEREKSVSDFLDDSSTDEEWEMRYSDAAYDKWEAQPLMLAPSNPKMNQYSFRKPFKADEAREATTYFIEQCVYERINVEEVKARTHNSTVSTPSSTLPSTAEIHKFASAPLNSPDIESAIKKNAPAVEALYKDFKKRKPKKHAADLKTLIEDAIDGASQKHKSLKKIDAKKYKRLSPDSDQFKRDFIGKTHQQLLVKKNLIESPRKANIKNIYASHKAALKK